MSVVSSDAEQHNREIHENRKAWARKPVLRRAYAELYRTTCENIEPSIQGSKVELGSGMSNIRDHLPECITTDLFPNPWLDRVENAYQLSFSRVERAFGSAARAGAPPRSKQLTAKQQYVKMLL
jgi:hypothetical protein